MDFFDLINRRESCRSYDKTRPVEPEKLQKMIEAVRIAPSACNSQPWRFIVVTDPQKKQEAAACLQDMGMNRFASDAPALIAIVEEPASLSAKVIGRFKDQDFAQIDNGIAAAYLALAASELGLSTCIMGWVNEPKLKTLLGVPKERRIRLVLSVGYASDDALREKKRKSIGEIAEFI